MVRCGVVRGAVSGANDHVHWDAAAFGEMVSVCGGEMNRLQGLVWGGNRLHYLPPPHFTNALQNNNTGTGPADSYAPTSARNWPVSAQVNESMCPRVHKFYDRCALLERITIFRSASAQTTAWLKCSKSECSNRLSESQTNPCPLWPRLISSFGDQISRTWCHLIRGFDVSYVLTAGFGRRRPMLLSLSFT